MPTLFVAYRFLIYRTCNQQSLDVKEQANIHDLQSHIGKVRAKLLIRHDIVETCRTVARTRSLLCMIGRRCGTERAKPLLESTRLAVRSCMLLYVV